MLTSTVLTFLIISYPQIDPVAIRIRPIPFFGSIWIRWYGLAYVAGLLLGWLYLRRLVANGRMWLGGVAPITLEHVDALLLWIMAGVVLGGRLIGIVLYDPTPFISDPMEILRVWHGGMAFHGALLGVTAAIFLFAWRHGGGRCRSVISSALRCRSDYSSAAWPFHQWRTLGTGEFCALGDGLSGPRRRTTATPSQSAL